MGNTYAARITLIMLIAAATAEPARANDTLFGNAKAPPLEVRLSLPLKAILKEKANAATEHPAHLYVEGHTLPLVVTRRGKSRQAECKFPPLRLNLKKKATRDTPFAGQNKLKLVTHCRSGFATRGYLAAELLAYQLLNHFTAFSFRTRALKITYEDAQTHSRQQQWAFVIEHKSDLAKRNRAKANELNHVPHDDLAGKYSTVIAVYQYLIGNTDFSFTRGPAGDDCCHNVVPLTGAGGKVYPVPYDFDASGLVNPPYAAPVPNLGITKVTQRLYRGYCMHNEYLDEVIAEFIAARPKLYRDIEGFDTLPNLKTGRIKKFVDKFYATIENNKGVENKLVRKCR